LATSSALGFHSKDSISVGLDMKLTHHYGTNDNKPYQNIIHPKNNTLMMTPMKLSMAG